MVAVVGAAVLVAVVVVVVAAVVPEEGVWRGSAEVLWLAGWQTIAVNLYNEETRFHHK